MFGRHPYFEAAYIGGGLEGIAASGTSGMLGFADAGRVYLDGEDSDKLHNGYGGGLWFAWLDRANVVSATYARSEGDTKIYVRAGFAF